MCQVEEKQELSQGISQSGKWDSQKTFSCDLAVSVNSQQRSVVRFAWHLPGTILPFAFFDVESRQLRLLSIGCDSPWFLSMLPSWMLGTTPTSPLSGSAGSDSLN